MMFGNLVPRVYATLRSAARHTGLQSEPAEALEANALEDRILFNASPVDAAVDGGTDGGDGGDATSHWLIDEDYSGATTDAHDPQSGTWDVVDGQYVATPGSDAVSALDLNELDDNVELEVTINADDASAQHLSNAFVIFDYRSATDFKFAGAYAGVDQWVIGHRDASGWVTDGLQFAPVDAFTDYQLRLKITGGSQVTLYADDNPVVTRAYADTLTEGQLGLGTKNAVARFDDLRVRCLPGDTEGSAGELPIMENFDDALADHLSPAAGDWLLVDGSYEVTPAIGGAGVSVLKLSEDVPDDVEIGVTFEADEIVLGRFTNGVIIFDYQGVNDFKYAGGFLNRDEWVIGQRTVAGWMDEVAVSAPIDAFTDYNIRVVIEDGSDVSLYADDSVVASHTFSEVVTDGAIGLGSNNSVTRFDDFSVVGLSPQVSNIVAGLDGSNLIVTGEAAGELLIAAQQSNAFQIFDNGELLYEFSGVEGNLRIELGEADDHVTLNMNGFTFRQSVFIDLGEGHNRLNVLDGTVGRHLHLLAGSGGDDFSIADNVAIGGHAVVDLGDGSNQFYASETKVGGHLKLTGGSDQDFVQVEDVEIRRHVFATLGDGLNEFSVVDSQIGRHLKVTGGTGEDVISIAEDVSINRSAKLSTGADDDTIFFAGTSGFGLFANMGDGDDSLHVSGQTFAGLSGRRHDHRTGPPTHVTPIPHDSWVVARGPSNRCGFGPVITEKFR